jgi:multiple sugar transport system substrate-binding protein
MSDTFVSRRRFLVSAVVIVGSGLAAACGAPTAPAAPTQGQAAPAAAPTQSQAAAAPTTAAATSAPATKTSPSGVFRYAIDNDTETRKPVVEAFLAKNYPNVKAQFEVTPEGYFEKLLSQIAAKNPPDLAYIHESRFLDFASQGALQPLDPFMAKQPLIDGNDKYGLDILKNNNNYKGMWYTMPIGMAYLFVRYNKTMFEKAGVPLPSPSWTWDDLKSAAAKLTKDTGDVNAKQWGWIGWDPSWMPSWWPLMQSYGAFHYNDDRSQCILNNAAGVQVLDYMRSTWADKVSPTPAAKTQLASGTLKLFEGGLAAMDYVLSPNVISSLKNIADKFEMGIEEFPSGPKGQFVRTGGSSMSIPVGAKNPDLAWEVLRFMIGDEQANKDAATYMDGNPLVRLDYALKYNVPSGPLADKMKSIMTEGFQKHGTVVQYGPVGEYSNIVRATMDKLASGEMTAQQAADDIASQTNKLLKEKQG